MWRWITQLWSDPDDRHAMDSVSVRNLRHYQRDECRAGVDLPYWPTQSDLRAKAQRERARTVREERQARRSRMRVVGGRS
jgi:hypothetical protein